MFYKQWLPAVVAMISSGLERKRGKKGQQLRIPAGQYFLEFDDGEKRWASLKADNFNCMRAGSWRLDLDEPGASWPSDDAGGGDSPDEADVDAGPGSRGNGNDTDKSASASSSGGDGGDSDGDSDSEYSNGS